MTFSIVARSADGTAYGVAVASKFLAVGAAVPAADARAGAVATQAYANLAYREAALARLVAGEPPAAVLAALVDGDDLRSQRQLGLVGRTGDGVSFTGDDCHEHAGSRTGDGYAVQGNILAGPGVLAAVEEAWLGQDPATPLTRRLLGALTAGQQAGGDRRGQQSAALLVVVPGGGYGGGSDVFADLRVDDAAEPVRELARLLDLHDLYFGRPDPSAVLPLTGILLDEVHGLLTQLGHPPAGDGPDAVRAALWDWAGVANLEMRVWEVDGLDPVVLEVLRLQAAEGDLGPTRSAVEF